MRSGQCGGGAGLARDHQGQGRRVGTIAVHAGDREVSRRANGPRSGARGPVAVIFSLCEFVHHPAAVAVLFPALRWIALAALIVYGCMRRTLTAWIFIAMLLGAEIGHDFPNAATHLRVLALIFLRVIKAIIAPLLFGTLVVGIAGHSNLKQVR